MSEKIYNEVKASLKITPDQEDEIRRLAEIKFDYKISVERLEMANIPSDLEQRKLQDINLDLAKARLLLAET